MTQLVQQKFLERRVFTLEKDRLYIHMQRRFKADGYIEVAYEDLPEKPRAIDARLSGSVLGVLFATILLVATLLSRPIIVSNLLVFLVLNAMAWVQLLGTNRAWLRFDLRREHYFLMMRAVPDTQTVANFVAALDAARREHEERRHQVTAPSRSPALELQRLVRLRALHQITDEEFEALRAEILTPAAERESDQNVAIN